jgi:hypothetical protein
MDEETKTQIVALQIEVEGLRAAVDYLLWRVVYEAVGEARNEARDYQEGLLEAFARAQKRRSL